MADTDGFRNDWATKDFYQVLGVAKDASAADIKKAYRKLARENHPDSNPGDDAKHEKFKAVAEAYDVVGDEAKRAKYDEFRSLQARGGFGPGMGGGVGGPAVASAAAGSTSTTCCATAAPPVAGSATCSATCSAAARARRTQQQARPRRGADVESTATIGFTDALDGVTVSLRLTSDAACPTCQGTGGKPGTRPHICPRVRGRRLRRRRHRRSVLHQRDVPGCGGRQLVYDEACPTCHGSGRGTSARTDPGPHPRRRQGRREDPAQGQGRAR